MNAAPLTLIAFKFLQLLLLQRGATKNFVFIFYLLQPATKKQLQQLLQLIYIRGTYRIPIPKLLL